jgi:putative Holliday junction resolvase
MATQTYILGLDYGRRKIGLALADIESKLAEPLRILRVDSMEDALKKVSRVSGVSRVSKVVMGVSEGKMAEETKEFGRKLEKKLRIPVVFQDETLTTHEAQKLSQKAGIKRAKRKEMEDAYSATLILQSYLDNH